MSARNLGFAGVGIVLGFFLGFTLSPSRPAHSYAKEAGLSDHSAKLHPKAAAGRQSEIEQSNILLGDINTVPFQELFSVLSNLSPQKLNELAKQLNGLPGGRETNTKIAVFFKAWAHFEPISALRAAAAFKSTEAKIIAVQAVIDSADASQAESLAKEIRDWPADVATSEQRNIFLASALMKWADLDPAGAAKVFDATQERTMRFNAAASIIAQNWAAIDPSAAVAWAQTHNDTPGFNRVLNGAITGWWTKDHEAAESYAITQSKTDLQLVTTLATYMASKDPERAKAWISQVPDVEARRRADSAVAMQLAFNDPRGASAWAATLPDDVRERALSSTINVWASNDLSAAGEWINGLSGPARDEAVSAYIYPLQVKDPATAASWAGTISDSKIRDRSLQNVVTIWLSKNPSAASAWIQGSNLPAADKRRLLALAPGG